jgi:hypothetical protein
MLTHRSAFLCLSWTDEDGGNQNQYIGRYKGHIKDATGRQQPTHPPPLRQEKENAGHDRHEDRKLKRIKQHGGDYDSEERFDLPPAQHVESCLWLAKNSGPNATTSVKRSDLENPFHCLC